MFQYIPLKDPSAPREVSVGRYYLAPPARVEEGWSLNVYTRKAGSGEPFKARYKEPGRQLTYLPVLEKGVHGIQTLSYDLVNTAYGFGDTVEYYFELQNREAGNGAYQSMEAPPIDNGFIVAVPTTGYRANTKVEFYCVFYRQDSPIGTYGSAEVPRSFKVMPR